MKSTIVCSAVGLGLLLGGAALARGHSKKVHHPQKSNQVLVNKATAKELQKLPGIGAATAKRMVEYREKNGNYKSLKDLLHVRGMSAHKLQALDKRVGL